MTKHGTTSEILLTTTENLSDEILFKTANSFLEDAVKSIPFASLITGSIETYTRFRILKEQKQLLSKKQKILIMVLPRSSLNKNLMQKLVWKF